MVVTATELKKLVVETLTRAGAKEANAAWKSKIDWLQAILNRTVLTSRPLQRPA
jgi:hypothetical protein